MIKPCCGRGRPRSAGLYLLAAILSLASVGDAATWYLDKDASGSADGTSWANAWTTGIVNTAVNAGDTIKVSGGATEKVYTFALGTTKSGTPAAPIIVQNGREAGHNGIARFTGFSFGTSSNIHVDGARSDSFSAPTSVLSITAITNNLGFCFGNTNATGNSAAVFISGAGGNGGRLKWCEVFQGTTNNLGDQHGVQFLNLTVIRDWLIDHCWIHHVQNDGVNVNSVTVNPEAFDALTVRWCLIEQTGDDGIQSVRNGTTVSHCMLREQWQALYNGHPDHHQMSGVSSRYLKLINSIFYNKGNSHVIGEHYVTEGGTLGPMVVAGNLFYIRHDYADFLLTNQAYGVTLAAWRPNSPDTNVLNATWDGLRVVNNTMYFQRAVAMSLGRADPGDATTRSVWMLNITNSEVSNNLFLDCGYTSASGVPFAFGMTGPIGSSTNGMFGTTNEFPVRHNIFAGSNTRVYYNGVTNATGEAIGLGNTSTRPSIMSTQAYDFRLQYSDTVARDRGVSLASLTNIYPELMTDLYGNIRGIGAGWDIGAHEFGAQDLTNELVLHYNYDGATLTTSNVLDQSGRGNHGKHFGYDAGATGTNRFPVAVTWTNKLTGAVESGALFERLQDNWDEYGESGRYVGVTNFQGGWRNTNKLTFATWHRYSPGTGAASNNWTVWGNRRFAGGGSGYKGAWTCGLFGAQFSSLRCYSNNNANADYYMHWLPDRVSTSGNAQGDSTNMAHLAFTWDDGRCVLYYDGQPILTNIVFDPGGGQLTNLIVSGPGGSLVSGYFELGGDSHNGQPYLASGGVGDDGTGAFWAGPGTENQYPNHGFDVGWADDTRIYVRVLTAADIALLASGTGGAAPEMGGGTPLQQRPPGGHLMRRPRRL